MGLIVLMVVVVVAVAEFITTFVIVTNQNQYEVMLTWFEPDYYMPLINGSIKQKCVPTCPTPYNDN